MKKVLYISYLTYSIGHPVFFTTRLDWEEDQPINEEILTKALNKQGKHPEMILAWSWITSQKSILEKFEYFPAI